MKITQTEIDGAGNQLTFRVEFNHAARRPLPNKHDVSVSKEFIDLLVKNGGYTCEPGFEFTATTQEEATAGWIDYQLKKANLLRIEEKNLPDFTEPETHTDTSHIQSLVDICFNPGMKRKVIIRPDQIFLPYGENEKKQLTGTRITPLDNAFDKCGCKFVQQIQDCVHTPEIKQAYLDSLFKPDYLNRSERDVAGTTTCAS